MADKGASNIARSTGLTLKELHARPGGRITTVGESQDPAAPPEDEFSRALKDAERVDSLAIRRSARQRLVLEGQVEEEETQTRLREIQARRIQAEAEAEKVKLELRKMQQQQQEGQGEFIVHYVSKLEEQLVATREEIANLREAGRQAEVGALQKSLTALQAEIAAMQAQAREVPQAPSLLERIREVRGLRQEWQALEEEIGGPLKGQLPEVSAASDVGGQLMLYRVKRELDIRDRVEQEKLRLEEDDQKDRRAIERRQVELGSERNQILQQNLPTIFQALDMILRGLFSQQGRLPPEMAPQQQEVDALSEKLGATPGMRASPQLINCACGARVGVAPGQNRAMCPRCGTVYEPRETPGDNHGQPDAEPPGSASEVEMEEEGRLL